MWDIRKSEGAVSKTWCKSTWRHFFSKSRTWFPSIVIVMRGTHSNSIADSFNSIQKCKECITQLNIGIFNFVKIKHGFLINKIPQKIPKFTAKNSELYDVSFWFQTIVNTKQKIEMVDGSTCFPKTPCSKDSVATRLFPCCKFMDFHQTRYKRRPLEDKEHDILPVSGPGSSWLLHLTSWWVQIR